MRIGVGVMALASSLLVNFFLVFQLLSSASRPQHPTREQVDLPLSLAVLEKRNAQLGDLKRAVELSLMRPVDLVPPFLSTVQASPVAPPCLACSARVVALLTMTLLWCWSAEHVNRRAAESRRPGGASARISAAG